MKLYVRDPEGHTIYLVFHNIVERRIDIPPNFSVVCQICNRRYNFQNNQVLVEQEYYAASSAILGGIIGVLGGSIGIILGASIGYVIGSNAEAEERNRIHNFG